MAYRIEGLAPAAFESLFGMMDGELAARGAVRVWRIRRRLSVPGDAGRCRAGGGIGPAQPRLARRRDAVPLGYAHLCPQGRRDRGLHRRAARGARRPTLGLRGFDADGMLRGALLALPGEADAQDPRAVRAAGDRHHPRAQRGLWLLRGANREELTMASLATDLRRDRSAAVNDALHHHRRRGLGRLRPARPELGRADHRRREDDRHLLPAELPRAAAQA